MKTGGVIFALIFFGTPMFLAGRALYLDQKKHSYKPSIDRHKIIDNVKAAPSCLLSFFYYVGPVLIGLMIIGFALSGIGIAAAPFCKIAETIGGYIVIAVMAACIIVLIGLGLHSLLNDKRK